MPTPLPFVKLDDPRYGELVPLSPLVRRIIARNPGPFTYTGSGAYVIGRGEVAVIDPGPLDAAHVAALKAGLGDERISHVLITHTHLDHSPAARLIDAPTYGFGPHARHGESGEEGGDLDFTPDVVIGDGDRIAGQGWSFEALYTPGHISNHLCFALAEERALFTGDHVMGWSTTVIAPPDGDMADYMFHLQRLLARDDRIFYPTHGAPVTDPKPLVRALIAHRHEREDQILACLGNGPLTIPAMVETIYQTVDKRLHPAAARSVLAHLIRMAGQKRVIAEPDGRYRIPT